MTTGQQFSPFGENLFGEPIQQTTSGLASKFIVPPFSTLNTAARDWQDRKRAWLSYGIRSELGRGDNLAFRHGGTFEFDGNTVTDQFVAGTSVFDPVLCELMYEWFSPVGGTVLDPFAGGSVRGIVAAMLGRHYTGIELRPEQVAANRAQYTDIVGGAASIDDTAALTPVERVGDVWIKRDDTFAVGGSRGGKVRTCATIIRDALAAGPVAGVVTAGSRQSPQVNIVATLAQVHGLPCRVHVPGGELTPELIAARDAGADIVQHSPGYNTVITARARDDAAERGWLEIPFGMEHPAAVSATAAQVANIPDGVQRIVVPVGSGMTLAGILQGLRDHGRAIPVVGVVVGADPTKRLDRYAPVMCDWRDGVDLVDSGLDYHDHAPDTRIGDVDLDPIYESKCLPFLQSGDLLWVVGRRGSMDTAAATTSGGTARWYQGDSMDLDDLLPDDGPVDMVFSCPPYGDLERYSDDPRDLSTMEWHTFVAALRRIIMRSVRRLRDDRFAVFVVGDIRDRAGHYRGFVGETIAAFAEQGLHLYNHAILLTPVGSVRMTAAVNFRYRKLSKTHQDVLVFVKGDGRRATDAIRAAGGDGDG